MTYIQICHLIFWAIAIIGAVCCVGMWILYPESFLLYLCWVLFCVAIAFLRFYIFI